MCEHECKLTSHALLTAVHSLPEVRRRALQSLDFKVKHGLLSQQDFLQVSHPGHLRLHAQWLEMLARV